MINDPENPLRSLDASVVTEDTWAVRRKRMGRVTSYLVVACIVGFAIWSMVTSA